MGLHGFSLNFNEEDQAYLKAEYQVATKLERLLGHIEHERSREVNTFPMFFAFSNEQFAKCMAKLGLTPTDTDKICRFRGISGYYQKGDAIALVAAMLRNGKPP